jgi:Cu(I)/Ag(I) efflux system membrane fusion protein/cobalt-zinc-cadmium efflux system membrane fusion protein
MPDNSNSTNKTPEPEGARFAHKKGHLWRWTGAGILIGLALAAFVVINPLHWKALDGIRHALLGHEATPKEESESGLWTCGMHPQVIQDAPGICPICNMNLTPLKRTTLGDTTSQAPSSEPKEPAKRKIKYWVAPMDPTYISDKPGKSPMGMDLVPVYEGEEKSTGPVITIDPTTVQNIGVKSKELLRGDLAHTIRTVGILDYNNKAIYWITTKYDGWIQKVYVNYIGEHVTKGQKLFEIYSPDLVSTQEEYLTALDYAAELSKAPKEFQTRGPETLLDAARKRLDYWDITEEQIKTLEQTRQIKKTLTVVSHVDGYVAEKMDEALEGIYVKPGMNLYKIADLSTVWIHADIYEYDLPWIQVGQEVEIDLPYFPGERFSGKVLYEYPYVSEKTRTMRICVEAPNPGKRLRPGMYANARIKTSPVINALQVPEEAVIHSGERNVVIVDKGGGRFEPRTVILGIHSDGVFQVKSGLHDGERIVTSAQFLIDSESNLREAINKMIEEQRGATPAVAPATLPQSETPTPPGIPATSGHIHGATTPASTIHSGHSDNE